MKAEIRSEEPLDVTAPGALPFIDFEISEFDELVAATEQIQSLGHSVVRTPAGPLVIGYDDTRETVSYTHLPLPTPPYV